MFEQGNSEQQSAFLQRYWQREVCFFPADKNTAFKLPLSANELAGLAMEEDVQSRIVTFDGDTWHLQHGPFCEQDFRQEKPWTLLVQKVDQLIPDLDYLWDQLDFIPRWRRDDIMVSYASKGGGVGPHFDRYDVFLLQGAGKRTWHIGQRCDETTALKTGSDLCLLENFELTQSFSCTAGDVLYIPPGVAHWGTADDDDCMTFSLGFRAPRQSDLLSRLCDQALENLPPTALLSDHNRKRSDYRGEITQANVDNALAQLMVILKAQACSPKWFGEVITDTDVDWIMDETEAEQLLASSPHLYLNPEAQVAWQRQEPNGLLVFCNGHCVESIPEAAMLLETLLSSQELSAQHIKRSAETAKTKAVLVALLCSGAVIE